MNRLILEEKVKLLENKDLNWLEISDILGISYEEVRFISEKVNE